MWKRQIMLVGKNQNCLISNNSLIVLVVICFSLHRMIELNYNNSVLSIKLFEFQTPSLVIFQQEKTDLFLHSYVYSTFITLTKHERDVLRSLGMHKKKKPHTDNSMHLAGICGLLWSRTLLVKMIVPSVLVKRFVSKRGEECVAPLPQQHAEDVKFSVKYICGATLSFQWVVDMKVWTSIRSP